MIRWFLLSTPIVIGASFAAGCWVGWKTTMRAMDAVKKVVTDGR